MAMRCHYIASLVSPVVLVLSEKNCNVCEKYHNMQVENHLHQNLTGQSYSVDR